MRQKPLESPTPEGTSRWAVTVTRPAPDELADLDRAQKYQLLEDNSARWREELLRWLKEHGLADQVADVSQPTAFNMLFVTATSSVAERLANAPGVISVTQAGEFAIDLPKPPARAASPRRKRKKEEVAGEVDR